MTQFTIDFNIRVKSTLQKELKKSVAQTKKVNASLKKTKSNMRSLLPSIRQINQRFGNLRFTLQNIQFLLFAIGGAAIFGKAIKSANDFERQMIGLNLTANQFQANTVKLTKAVKDLASEGMVPLEDITTALRNLMIITNGDVDKSIDAFRKFRDVGSVLRQGHLDLGKAVRGTTEGLKDLLSIKSDNIGLSENLGNIIAREAKLLGVSEKSFTLKQKRLIVLNSFMKKSINFQGAFNRVLATTGGALSQVASQFNFFLISLGETVTKSQTARKMVKALSVIIKDLTKSIEANKEAVGTVFVGGLLNAALAAVTLVKALFTLRSIGLKIIFMFRELNQEVSNFGTTVKNKLISGFAGLIVAGKHQEKVSKSLFNALQKSKTKGIFSDDQKKALAKDIEAADTLLKIITEIQKKLAKGIAAGPGIKTGAVGGVSGTAGGVDIPGINDVFKSLTNGITSFFKGISGKGGALEIASKVGEAALQGEAGVGNLVGQIPIIGGFLKALGTMSKEQVRENVKAFAEAIPVFIEVLVENMPVFIDAFASGMIHAAGKFVQKIVTNAPRFIEELVKGAGKFVEALIKEITGGIGGKGGLFKKGGILGSGIGPSGGLVEDNVPVLGKLAHGGTVGKIAKFANGGSGSIIGRVPPGFPADTFPAALTSEETVITRDTTRKLDNFLERQTSGMQVVNVSADIQEKTLIDIIIRLKRNGQLDI